MHQFLFDVYVAELISYTWNQLWTFTFLNFEEIIKGEKNHLCSISFWKVWYQIFLKISSDLIWSCSIQQIEYVLVSDQNKNLK